MLDLVGCQWIKRHLNIMITGPTGVGKTWIACALAQKACREGYRAPYLRLPKLLQELPIAKGDGTYIKLLTRLAKIDVLILDDWGLSKLMAEQRRDLLEILEDRYDNRSTIVTSQLPVDKWHDIIGYPTLADAILDRLVHNLIQDQSERGIHAKKKNIVDGTHWFRVTICKSPCCYRSEGGRLDQFRWLTSNGMGGRNHRNTQLK